MSNKAATAYLATQVTTTSQGQLLLMLYDAAINFLKRARVKIEARDYAAKGILISRATDILSELNQSLNKTKGGQLAQNLNSLYLFCNTQLAKANMRMDTALVDDVVNILSNLRNAYGEIVPQYDSEPAEQNATQPAAPATPDHFPKPQLLKPVEQPAKADDEQRNSLNTARSRAANAYANSL